MEVSRDITDDERDVILTTMPTRIHFKPSHKPPVCGILRECTDLATDGRITGFLYRHVLTTSTVRMVNCPKCALVLRADVNFICTRAGV